MEEVAFFFGALGALGGAMAVIALRNPFYSVLALVVHLFSLAGLFLMLHAEFIAAAQIVVYAGAVMVLYVFVTAYVGGIEEPVWEPIPGQRLLAPLLGGALFIELAIAVLGSSLQALGDEGPTVPFGFGTPADIGELLLEKFLIAFEASSILLLLSAVAAVVLAGKKQNPKARQDMQATTTQPAPGSGSPSTPLQRKPDSSETPAGAGVGAGPERFASLAKPGTSEGAPPTTGPAHGGQR